MKKWFCIWVPIAIAINVQAQAPEMFRYQGRLVDGTNLVNATLPMSFKLYDAQSGGNPLYEDSNSVLVVDGLYSTYIGDNTVYGSLTNALTNAMVYLELTVNGETLSPRERLVSVPYALCADVDLTGYVQTTNSVYTATVANAATALKQAQADLLYAPTSTVPATAAALALKLDATGANITNQPYYSTTMFLVSDATNSAINGVYYFVNSDSWTNSSAKEIAYDAGQPGWIIDSYSGTEDSSYPWDAGWTDFTASRITVIGSVASTFRNNLDVYSKEEVDANTYTKTETSTLLSNKANVVYNTEMFHKQPLAVFTNVNETIVSFIFDDGADSDTNLIPIFVNAGVPACIALTYQNNNVAGHALELQNTYGWEMLGHSAHHPNNLTNGTLAQITAEIFPPIAYYAAQGIVMKNFVCPENRTNERLRQELAKYYRSSFGSSAFGPHNTPPVFQYALNRIGISSFTLGDMINWVTNAPPKTWVCYWGHSGDPNLNLVTLSAFLGYLGSNGIPVLTVDKALDRRGNVIQVGDYIEGGTSTCFVVGANGSVTNRP